MTPTKGKRTLALRFTRTICPVIYLALSVAGQPLHPLSYLPSHHAASLHPQLQHLPSRPYSPYLPYNPTGPYSPYSSGLLSLASHTAPSYALPPPLFSPAAYSPLGKYPHYPYSVLSSPHTSAHYALPPTYAHYPKPYYPTYQTAPYPPLAPVIPLSYGSTTRYGQPSIIAFPPMHPAYSSQLLAASSQIPYAYNVNYAGHPSLPSEGIPFHNQQPHHALAHAYAANVYHSPPPPSTPVHSQVAPVSVQVQLPSPPSGSAPSFHLSVASQNGAHHLASPQGHFQGAFQQLQQPQYQHQPQHPQQAQHPQQLQQTQHQQHQQHFATSPANQGPQQRYNLPLPSPDLNNWKPIRKAHQRIMYPVTSVQGASIPDPPIRQQSHSVAPNSIGHLLGNTRPEGGHQFSSMPHSLMSEQVLTPDDIFTLNQVQQQLDSGHFNMPMYIDKKKKKR